MNKYLQAQEDTFDNLLKQVNAETDPRHQAMLRNYMRHMAMEISGRWSDFIDDTDSMMSDSPLYNVRLGTPDTVQYHGIGGVKDFYSTIDTSVWMLQSAQTALADWGLSALIYNTQLMRGSDILAAGLDISAAIGGEVESDTVYVMEDVKIAMFWPYDERARLAGEDVYQLEPPKAIVKCARENLTTKQDIERSLSRFFKA